MITDLPPTLKWTLAIIAGGGAAGLTQGGTVLARAHSTAFTAAVGNPVVATVEVGGAIIMSLMSLIAPVIALALLGVLALSRFVCSYQSMTVRAVPMMSDLIFRTSTWIEHCSACRIRIVVTRCILA